MFYFYIKFLIENYSVMDLMLNFVVLNENVRLNFVFDQWELNMIYVYYEGFEVIGFEFLGVFLVLVKF